MDNRDVLLSICIPTYNRADLLDQNLGLLLSLEEFDDAVELVISDNNSTDNTKEVVDFFASKYSGKRIVYSCNKENIRDKNFLKALSLGTGAYLKLFNDYTIISNDDLATLKDKIRRNLNLHKQLFFYNKVRLHNIKKYEEVHLNDTNNFLRLVNNKITWISSFGCWREQVVELNQFDKYASLQLLQVFWTLHLVSKSKETIVVNMKYSLLNTHDQNRTNYNFFQVHVGNYYSILETFQDKGLISKSTIKYDKYRVLSDFVGNSISKYLILRKDSHFETRDSWEIIFRHFWNIPYLYFLPFHQIIRKIWKLICGKR